MLLTKDFRKFKVLDTTKSMTAKKSHAKFSPQKPGKHNTFFEHKAPSAKTRITSSKYQQNMSTVLCDVTIFNHCTGPPELGEGHGDTTTTSDILN